MTLKLATANHIPWKEQIDLLEVDALTDEYAWDDLLEAVEEGMAGSGVSSARRVSTPLPNFRRHDAAKKTAATSNWDSDFADAQAHARELLSKLGTT